ncbi:MAG: exonuclease SbcCD subunit D [Oscillospiraceae bacterium]|nr:exonuclease SbcCD subunit D [Oscillospiraceae bacterium]
MKLLHTSDWHLGLGFQSRSYEADQRFFIDEICRVIRDEQVDAVLLAGDVFDRGVPSAGATRLYDYAVTRICAELHVPMLVIAGNHDNAARLASCRELLKQAGLYLCGELTTEPPRVALDNADVYLLPWFSTEKARAVYPDRAAEIQSMEDAYRVVLDGVRERFRPGRRQILLSHAFVVDAETSVSDRAAEVGRAAAVSRSVFEGFDYCALGHLHGPQDIGANIRYSGTPMKYAFGTEERQIKSVTLLDTETMARQIIPLSALHERATVSGSYETVLAAEGLTPAQKEGYIRVQVTDRYLGLAAASALFEVYPNLLEYTGQSFDAADGSITLTLDELEAQTQEPEQIFRRFYEDTVHGVPDQHLLDLFRAAVAESEGGADA